MPMCRPAPSASRNSTRCDDEEQRHPLHELHAVDARGKRAVRRHEEQQQHRLAGRRVALHLGAALAEDEHLAGGLEQVVRRQDQEHRAASSAGRWSTSSRRTSAIGDSSALRPRSRSSRVGRRRLVIASPAFGSRLRPAARACVRARPASSRWRACGSRPAIGRAHAGCARWPRCRSTRMNAPGAAGSPAGACDARRRGRPSRRCGRTSPVALSNADHDGRVRLRRRGAATRATAAFPNVSTPAAVERRIDDRVEARQVGAADLVAPLDQHVGQVLLGRRIAELPGLDDRANHARR